MHTVDLSPYESGCGGSRPEYVVVDRAHGNYHHERCHAWDVLHEGDKAVGRMRHGCQDREADLATEVDWEYPL